MGKNILELNRRLEKNLRPTTTALAMKYVKTEEELAAIPNLNILEDPAGVCTVIGLATGFCRTLAVRKEKCSISCGGANGVCDDREVFLSGVRLASAYKWHSNVETARKHMAAAQRDLPPVGYAALAVSPLGSGDIAEPDVILLNLEPGAAFHLLAGYQHNDFDEISFNFRGESSCAECWCHTFVTGKPGISLGCRGDRSYGALASNEIRLSMTAEDLDRALKGVEDLETHGIFYPYYPGLTLDLPKCESK